MNTRLLPLAALLAALALAGCKKKQPPGAPAAGAAAPTAGQQKAAPGQQKAPPPVAGQQKAQPGQQKAAPPAAQVAGRGQPAGAQGAATAPRGPVAADSPGPDSTHIDYRREVYNYQGGSRDPFVSLLTADESSVAFADLKLVSILYDAGGGRSVAVVHDRLINRDFRIRRGDTIGRLRVLQIRRYEVVFQIEEFGFERQEVLTLPRVEVNR